MKFFAVVVLLVLVLEMVVSSPIKVKRKSRLLDTFQNDSPTAPQKPSTPTPKAPPKVVRKVDKLKNIKVNIGSITLPSIPVLLWENGTHLMSQIMWKKWSDFKSMFTDEHVGGFSTFFWAMDLKQNFISEQFIKSYLIQWHCTWLMVE